MEQYFVGLASRLEGYELFEKEALAFKHLRLDTQRRGEKNGPPVKTSDIAHLLEIFQSCLLKYWEFSPVDPNEIEKDKESISNKPMKEWERQKLKSVRDKVKQEMSFSGHQRFQADSEPGPKGMEASRSVDVQPPQDQSPAEERKHLNQPDNSQEQDESSEWKPPTKLIPVFFIDEVQRKFTKSSSSSRLHRHVREYTLSFVLHQAHKLPALVKDQETMKCILDGLLVLTKQDRLCHVINATSDPFYMNWLRNMNVLTHCTIITIGDPPKKEAQQYFNENLLSTLRKKLDHQPICDARQGQAGNLILKHQSTDQSQTPHNPAGAPYELGFDFIYETFGGKLAHLQSFVGDYLNSGGRLKPKQSSPFLQAYALLHYHLVNPQYLPRDADQPTGSLSPCSHRLPIRDECWSVWDPMGPLSGGRKTDEKVEARTLLYVISQFTRHEVDPATGQIKRDEAGRPQRPTSSEARQTCSYFGLCRDIGIRAVDHLVRNRILDLRWTPPVSIDPDQPPNRPSTDPALAIVEPEVLPISPVMRAAMQTVLDQHVKESLL